MLARMLNGVEHPVVGVTQRRLQAVRDGLLEEVRKIGRALVIPARGEKGAFRARGWHRNREVQADQKFTMPGGRS